jgi:hypothetical protein
MKGILVSSGGVVKNLLMSERPVLKSLLMENGTGLNYCTMLQHQNNPGIMTS